MNKFYFAALAACAGLAMTSCSSDEIINEPVAAGSALISVNLTYAGLDDQTRTALEKDGRDLDCKWTEGDQVLVINTADGKKLGVLNIVEGAGTDKARFDGLLTGIESGEHQYSFFYLGNAIKDVDGVDVNTPYAYSFAVQNGDFEDFSDYDFLCNTATVSVEEGMAYVEDMGLKRKISFAHFTMTFPEGVTYAGQDVKISGTHLYNALDLTFGTPEGEGFSMDKKYGDITVKTNDMYIVIVPDLENTTNLNFTCDIDGQDYVATLGERQWKESEYVNLDGENGVVVAGKVNSVYSYTVAYNMIDPENAENVRQVKDEITDQPATYSFTIGKDFEGNNVDGAVFEDYDFLGWFASATATQNLNGQTCSLDRDNNAAAYWAKYEHKNYEFTLTFDPNGGAFVSGSDTEGTQFKKANSCVFYFSNYNVKVTRDNYEFLGWSETPNGAVITAETITVSKADNFKKTLYAIWKKKQTGGSTPGAGGSDY